MLEATQPIEKSAVAGESRTARKRVVMSAEALPG
jgi:hypothetical protein